MILLLQLSFLLNLQTQAQEPVSVNFKAVQECDKLLSEDRFKSKLDLTTFKETVNRHYPTLNQKLIEREIFLRGPDQAQKRIKLVGFQGPKQWQTELSVYRVNQSNEFELLPVQPKNRKNPQAKDLKPLFLNQQVVSEKAQYLDQKNNSVRMKWSEQNREVTSLEITFERSRKALSCERFEDGLTVCSCSKKETLDAERHN